MKPLNRQERRRLAKLKATEAANMATLLDRQERINDTDVKVWMMTYALAMNNVCQMDDDTIMKVTQEAVRILSKINGVDYGYDTLRDELYEVTGLEFELE